MHAVDTEPKLAKSSLDSPGAIVDALGGFLSTATDMVADFQTMPSMGLLALKGLVDKDFGPEEKQKVLEELLIRMRLRYCQITILKLLKLKI